MKSIRKFTGPRDPHLWFTIAYAFSLPVEKRNERQEVITRLGLCFALRQCAHEQPVNVYDYIQVCDTLIKVETVDIWDGHGYMFPPRNLLGSRNDPDWLPLYDKQRASIARKIANKLKKELNDNVKDLAR